MKAAAKPAHEGWSNYETWAVNLWISNDEPSYRYWRDVAKSVTPGPLKQRAADLAACLEDEFDYAKPDLGDTVWSHLLTSALGEVDWLEIATAMLQND